MKTKLREPWIETDNEWKPIVIQPTVLAGGYHLAVLTLALKGEKKVRASYLHYLGRN